MKRSNLATKAAYCVLASALAAGVAPCAALATDGAVLSEESPAAATAANTATTANATDTAPTDDATTDAAPAESSATSAAATSDAAPATQAPAPTSASALVVDGSTSAPARVSGSVAVGGETIASTLATQEGITFAIDEAAGTAAVIGITDAAASVIVIPNEVDVAGTRTPVSEITLRGGVAAPR